MPHFIWTPLRSHHFVKLAVVCVALFHYGCGEPSSECQVAGTILVDGKPAEGVYVAFHLSDDPLTTSAATQSGDDGAFTVKLPEPGEYSITAFWPKVIAGEYETIEGPDRFRGRYRNRRMPVTSVSITAGKNTVPAIDLSM